MVSSAKVGSDRELLFSYTGKGTTSKRDVTVAVHRATPGSGITFKLCTDNGGTIDVPARAENVLNTLRNVVLGKGSTRLCLVEHFLAAVVLWGLDDIDVVVDGPELPLADGSARVWIELLENCGVPRKTDAPRVVLPQPVEIHKGDRSLIAVPDEQFSVTYLMDWKHPLIGKKWQSWTLRQPITDVSDARTFGTLQEHQMLGLADDAVSLTEDGFTQPLRFDDEPVRHKLLDLIGDLALIGLNPLRLNARIISIKGGHELDVQLAKKLAEVCSA